MVIKGKLITCKRQVKEFKGKKTKEQLYVTLADVNLSDDKMKELTEAFKDAGKKFTPTWLTKFEGYVNLKTEFALPCKDIDGNEHDSVEDYIKESKYPYMGSNVKVSINVKEGAIYPNAICFLTEGKPFNPFSEFDNDDED